MTAADPDPLGAALARVDAAWAREHLAHWEMDEAQTARDFSVPMRIRPTRVRVA